MSVDLDKVVFASSYNAFKNNGTVYTGTIVTPGSLTGGQLYTGTSTFSIVESPVFSAFYGYYTELLDLSVVTIGTYSNQQWYPIDVGAFSGAGVWITAPAPQIGVLGCTLYPTISGSVVTVNLIIRNPYGIGVTLAATSYPYAFTIFTLAN